MTDSPLDFKIKKNLLRDTVHILNLNWKRKNKYNIAAKNEMANRLIGKQRITQKEREALRAKRLRQKDKFENNNMGDYQNLYPLKRGITNKDD
jgi:tubulin polyglutamylase TTLL6/13